MLKTGNNCRANTWVATSISCVCIWFYSTLGFCSPLDADTTTFETEADLGTYMVTATRTVAPIESIGRSTEVITRGRKLKIHLLPICMKCWSMSVGWIYSGVMVGPKPM